MRSSNSRQHYSQLYQLIKLNTIKLHIKMDVKQKYWKLEKRLINFKL